MKYKPQFGSKLLFCSCIWSIASWPKYSFFFCFMEYLNSKQFPGKLRGHEDTKSFIAGILLTKLMTTGIILSLMRWSEGAIYKDFSYLQHCPFLLPLPMMLWESWAVVEEKVAFLEEHKNSIFTSPFSCPTDLNICLCSLAVSLPQPLNSSSHCPFSH